MKYIKFIAMLAVLTLVAAGSPRSADAIQNFTVRVGISRGVASGKLYGQGLSLKTAKGHVLTAGNGSSVTIKNGNLVVGGKQLAMPVTVTAKSGLGWNGTKYRGSLRFIKAGRGFTVINDVDVENYVRGVLNAEMSAKWHIEALKAQAVLARTYVAVNKGGYGSEGFDVTDDTSSQVYRGASAETPQTDKAVAATAGEVLTYGGAPAQVYFHSDSGGATADVSDVWGKSLPYLTPVAERMPNESPNASWTTVMAPDQIAGILAKMGKRVGSVRSIAVTRRDAYGRAVEMRVVGTAGSADFSAHAFRMACGPRSLKSTNFALCPEGSRPQYRDGTAVSPASPAPTPARTPAPVQIRRGGDPLIEMTQNDIFTKDEIYDMLFNPEKRDQYIKIGYERMASRGMAIDAPAPVEAAPAPTQAAPQPQAVPVRIPIDKEVTGRVAFVGKGWGHGVGLSQWGAKAMADRGIKYSEILAHYFPGTAISK